MGLPCFVKAIRLLAKTDSALRDRIAYTVALFCGHLKSKHFADFMAWQTGISPGELQSINFRTKLPSKPASNYGITVASDTQTSCRANDEYYASSWGYGFFKYKACDYCDDVVGETADISVGDAWLKEYVNDSGGTNVVVVRRPELVSLIDQAIKRRELALEVIPPNMVVQSQEAGLRHRREGLAFRLLECDERSNWRPRKRVNASAASLSSRQQRIILLRERLASESHIAFQKAREANSFEVFRSHMKPFLLEYDSLYEPPLWRKLLQKLRARIGRIRRTFVAYLSPKSINR